MRVEFLVTRPVAVPTASWLEATPSIFQNCDGAGRHRAHARMP
ncbi:MAG TPA: hypothetical protein VMW48_19630 [Vicinamibacterales bacterium]|nr:hypothetical protein [Vicinamibacterales bacterium]